MRAVGFTEFGGPSVLHVIRHNLAERQLFVDILFEFEGALAFEDGEMGLLDESVEPPGGHVA